MSGTNVEVGEYVQLTLIDNIGIWVAKRIERDDREPLSQPLRAASCVLTRTYSVFGVAAETWRAVQLSRQ